MYGLSEKVFYEIIEILKKYSLDIEWVKIFGSRGRGDYKKNSDIDLAVKFRKNILLKLKDEFSESSIGYSVDIIDYERASNEKLKKYIDIEGKEIFLTNLQGEIKMNINKLIDKFSDYEKALGRLESSLEKDPNIDDLYIDGTIQRFEFVYELSWKLMKSYLEYNGIEVSSPRESFRESAKVGLLRDAGEWIQMMENRNRTSHTYDEIIAKDIYNLVKEEYIINFREFYQVIKNKI